MLRQYDTQMVLTLFSGGTLARWSLSINTVTIRRARLELGWVTVRGFESHSQHLGIQLPRITQPSLPLWVGETCTGDC